MHRKREAERTEAQQKARLGIGTRPPVCDTAVLFLTTNFPRRTVILITQSTQILF